MTLGRRQWLSGVVSSLGASVFTGPARAKAPALRRIDLQLDGKLARRALVLVPDPAPKTRLPVLVLLHGLGETSSAQAGIHAWADRYGLDDTYHRLRFPPVERTLPKARYLTDQRLASLNSALAARPYRGAIYVCPVTPNPSRTPSASATLDEYTHWLTDTLLPEVHRKTPADSDASRTALDGCSMGGYVALEVFCRAAERFGSLGTVQAAFGTHRASSYAERLGKALARSPARTLHVETSTDDPYRTANERLASLLAPRATLEVIPGPHNQPWLREIGTLEMLRHHDRELWSEVGPG